MSSFLLFHNSQPIEVQYTLLSTLKEERYVIKVGEVGTVIRLTDNGVWEIVGNTTIDKFLIQLIGDTILKLEKKWLITIFEFKSLKTSEQLDALSTLALLVSERTDDLFRYVLYQIEGFYVELQYRITTNAQESMRTSLVASFKSH